ncbi:MAG: hypothetical protein ABSH47_06765 [Bryobacteraceae bacterium]|jgi:hypothetical protein
MDIYKAIYDLIQERKRLDAVIASLETRSNPGVRERSRRGRKSMSPEERAAVSRRMAAYWAARRGQVAAPPQRNETTALPVEMPPPAPLVRAASGFEASLS